MRLRSCESCGAEFDSDSTEKRRAGGKIIHCPDCSTETATKYLGAPISGGKVHGIEVMAFESAEQREAYRVWRMANNGMFRGKVCQLGGNTAPPAGKYRVITSSDVNDNHKGKA
jgi:NAD-dependent SIR2 family protein deacetylase